MDCVLSRQDPPYLLDKQHLSLFQWPDTEESRHAKKFLTNLMNDGVKKYIDNVETELFLLSVNQTLLPITVNNAEYDSGYLVSNYYVINELLHHVKKPLKPLIYLLGEMLKRIKFNKVVIVNNWLIANNLYTDIDEAAVKKLTAYLVKTFPKHLIMYRSVNTVDGQDFLCHLTKLGHKTLYDRKIYYRSKQDKRGKREAYNRRRDERVAEREGYTLRGSRDYHEMIGLYNQVYREKHTNYSPHYNLSYFKAADESGFIEFKGLYLGDKLLGFFGFHIKNHVMSVPLFGYDLTSPNKLKIYQVLLMHIIKQADALDVSLNDGSGGGHAKSIRGLKRKDEYVLVYTKHLRGIRRLFWDLSCTCMHIRRRLR